MLRTRFITALILFPIVAILVYLGGWFFFAALAGMALLATWEFVHMMQVKGHKPHLLLAFGFALVPLLSMQAPEQRFFISTISILFVISLVWQLFQADSTAPVVDWALTIVGCYIGLGLGHLFGLRLLAEGIAWVWIALLSTWGCDSLAYFVGRAVGKRKFWPRLSPKKTWEGILGGVGGGMLGGFLVSLFSSIPLVHALIIGLLVSIAAPLGDVSISMMKRYAGVKDSSHLIPGHGGMLDRIDSLLFVAIVVFYYATWVVV